jgi:hypothetical protein
MSNTYTIRTVKLVDIEPFPEWLDLDHDRVRRRPWPGNDPRSWT